MENVKVKMSGYLYLKTKKRMISSWKNYWFVLEDRLLLFYRSKVEYEAISPCKGSINLGPPCTVKSLPSVANAFQIETRTVTYTLKAENSGEQKKWMQSILVALNQNQNFPTESPKRLNHFRYSLDDLVPEVEPTDSRVTKNAPLERQNTMPHRLKPEPKKPDEIIQRLQKMGAQSYGGSLEAISKIATKKLASPTLRKSASESKGSLPDCNIYERISGESQYSNRGSFLVDNENYSVPLRKPGGVGEAARETKSLMVDNDQYGTAGRRRDVQSDEVIYAEPKFDCNKNSVVVENSFYASADVGTHENVYEDLDKFSHYSQPVLKNVDDSSSQGQSRTKEGKSLKKSKSFVRKMWRKKSKKGEREKPPEENIYAEVDATAVEKVSVNDDSALQMLSELHNILESKKTKIKANASNNSSFNQSEEDSTPSSPNSDTPCPTLPPKTQKAHQPLEEDVRSLDEILEDLDKEKLESKSKVQMLIEKFSEPDSDDVVLRKHDRSESRTYSDELGTLLNELAKVTSAPIMTPGVTSSLVNPNLTDEEWLKLLPVRQRRLSEPDYDVPRPHKPIQLPVKPENSDAIPVTRFFGPVLPPDSKEDYSMVRSMTPDSLEVDQHKYQTHCSYTSHHYFNNQQDEIIYALPKSYVSVATHIVNTCQNICGATDEIVYKNVREEIFNDSLELCNETSTEF